MDFDDIIKFLVPKSTRKQIKKRYKKQGLFGLFKPFWRTFQQLFSNKKKASKPSINRSQRTVTKAAPKEDDPLLQNLAQVRVYQSKIEAMTRQAKPDSLARLRMEQLNSRVQDWEQTITEIVMRTLAQEEDELLTLERKQVPKAIKRLEKQLANTQDEQLRQKLELTLENRRLQLDELERKATNRQMTELKVENTLAQLSTIYAQLHNGQYMTNRRSYDRLTNDISDEVGRLDDYLSTLDELQRPALMQY